MKIRELALQAQTQVETFRDYEREGLLPQAPRSEGNCRIYGTAHVARLSIVRHCRSLDRTLDEVLVLLRFKDELQAECGGVTRGVRGGLQLSLPKQHDESGAHRSQRLLDHPNPQAASAPTVGV